mgnify:FL=1
MSELRLSKFIANCGVTSRRGAEELIAQGLVTVDGKVVTIQGVKIDPLKHKVEVQGKSLNTQTTKIYIVFHKPRGVLSTMSDPENRPCLSDYFQSRDERLFHVGRLDKESEGLILLSNDGAWAQKMAHPSYEVKKRYQVLVDRPLKAPDLRALEKGIELEDGVAKALSVTQQGRTLTIEIHEGRNQIIRRMVSALGFEVERLLRDQFGSIKLGELPPGKWRHLNSAELVNK